MAYRKSNTIKKSRRNTNISHALLGIFFFMVFLISLAKLYSIGSAYITPHKLNSTIRHHHPSSKTTLSKLSVTWPTEGQAALMIDGEVYGEHGDSTPVPTASLAKIMTAFVVLHKFPLSQGQDGPSYTVTPEDVELYDEETKDDDSAVKVVAGETLTERQMLEALLMPSADNVAVMLAKWSYGSSSAFVDEMNAEAKVLGLKYTNYADPAGISQETVSTASDQLRVASAAMSLLAFREIVNQQDARFPVVGTIKNTNSDLGQDGIIGLKTGNLAHIGNMAIAANRVVDNKHVLIIAVVLGQYGQNNFDSLNSALDAGKRLVESV
jgi:serine-type D-Ala-D-Ala carboxypeptidase (penicillin-binding protein 5/6)